MVVDGRLSSRGAWIGVTSFRSLTSLGSLDPVA